MLTINLLRGDRIISRHHTIARAVESLWTAQRDHIAGEHRGNRHDCACRPMYMLVTAEGERIDPETGRAWA